MDTLIKKEKLYKLSEYLKLEKETHEKHDFYFGEVYNMADGTIKHNLLTLSAYNRLYDYWDKKNCLVLINDVKLELAQNQFYVYPDIIVTCDKENVSNNADTIARKPVIVIEVLSDSTELYDRNIKKHYYLKLPSLKYYLLISQNETKIEMYEKFKNRIEYSYYEKPEQIIIFQQFDFEIKIADIYNVD
ncbi:MAG: Uma2 family endonuclease [Bacteroidota bacterium]|nr:Uma2 family endonuclease [Bacteroidota bacterium]